MTTHQSPEHASRELDAILADMTVSGVVAKRAAARIRKAVDAILLGTLQGPATVETLPVSFQVDVPKVTAALAEELTVHHLGLAAAYYEVAGPGLDLALARARDAAKASQALSLAADRAWLRELGRAYREMDGEEHSDD